MSGRGRVGIVAAGVAVVVAAVLAVRGCDDQASEPSDAPRQSPSVAAPSASSERRPRVRASAATDVSAVATTSAASGEPLLVDGWPAAEVTVRRPDGAVASGAVVYVHAAGADTPASLDEVVRRSEGEGRVTLVAPVPGRYDIGAFDRGGFATLVTDVEFPARAPVDVVLPETARLEIRSEGELPPTGYVTIWSAAAVRVTAFPGRRESKYAGFGTDRPLPGGVDVPRGVPLRVDVSGGLAVAPSTVTAPGAITVRSDGTQPALFEFVFTGAAPPAGVPLEYELRVKVAGGGAGFETTLGERTSGGSQVPPLLAKLPCVPGPVEVRWELVGVARGTAVVDTWRRPEGSAFRVEVPVPDWGPCVDALVVRVDGGAAGSAQVVTEAGQREIAVGREVRLSARGVAHVAAAGPRKGTVLVADPVPAETGNAVALRLVAGGTVRITIDRSPPLGAGWPVTVERADGLPILLLDPLGRNAPLLAARARIDGVRLVIGPLAAGDVELAFRLAGREFGRRRVTVRADEMVELVGPSIVPPGPR